jgi:hypothetical protein
MWAWPVTTTPCEPAPVTVQSDALTPLRSATSSPDSRAPAIVQRSAVTRVMPLRLMPLRPASLMVASANSAEVSVSSASTPSPHRSIRSSSKRA